MECFTLWNTGTAKCRFKLDVTELAKWAVEDDLYFSADPGKSAGQIWIRSDPFRGLPPSVTINVTEPFAAKRVIRVPQLPSVQQAQPESNRDGGDPRRAVRRLSNPDAVDIPTATRKALAHIACLPRVTVAMRNGDDAPGREVVAEVLSREPRRAADSVRDLVEVVVTQSAVLPMCSPN